MVYIFIFFIIFFFFFSYPCIPLFLFFFFLMIRPPPRSTLFPSTTLFRSKAGEMPYQAVGSYARVVPPVVFKGTADPVVAPINGDLVVQQWMQTDHLASHERYDASFANPSQSITASPPTSHPYIERSWNDSAGREVQEYWVAVGASHVWTGGSPAGTFTDPLGPDISQILYRFFLNHPMSLFPDGV